MLNFKIEYRNLVEILNTTDIASSLHRWMTDEMIDAATPSLLGDYPNTYTFTKGLAEYLIMEERENIPVIIVRPSIISGTYIDPFSVSTRV